MMTPGETPAPPTTAAQVLGVSGTKTPSPSLSPETPSALPAEPAAAAPPEKVSNKLQVLIQREKEAVKRERAAKALESAAQARETALAEREARVKEFESIKQTNPRKALALLGLDYQALTMAELNDGHITPDIKIQKVEEKFDSFMKAQEDAKRQEAEAAEKKQADEYAKALDNHKTEISKFLKENSARYELIAFEGNDDLVYDVIDAHYTRTLEAAQAKAEESGEDPADIRGEVLTIAAAADMVEAHLEKKYDKARDLAKVKALMAPRPSNPSAKPKATPSHTPKTLNNNLSATPATPRRAPRTDEDRIAEAIAAYRSGRL